MLVWQTNYLNQIPISMACLMARNHVIQPVGLQFLICQLSRISFDDEALQTDQGKTPCLSRDIELRPSFSARNSYFARDQSLLIYASGKRTVA